MRNTALVILRSSRSIRGHCRDRRTSGRSGVRRDLWTRMSSVSESEHERVVAEVTQLLDYVRNLGATDTEVEQALSVGGLGPLAVDLAIRPPGGSTTRDEFLSNFGVNEQLAH